MTFELHCIVEMIQCYFLYCVYNCVYIMTCQVGDKFRLKTGPNSGKDEIAITEANKNSINDVCTATKIADRLHKEFTEKGTTIANNTSNPTYYLRNQLVAGANVNRFYDIFTTKTESDDEYRKAVSAILKGDASSSASGETNYMNNPENIRNATDFLDPTVFKGLYGLVRVNEILEEKIASTVNNLKSAVSSNVSGDSLHYEKRKNIKTTLEEVANRENQLYRERFLNIIMLVVGVFIITSQLMKDYFSFSGGGSNATGSSGSSFGGIGGWLSTRFGSGSGGIFSRFGGLGLGSTGRSRVGNLFTNSPYTTMKRE